MGRVAPRAQAFALMQKLLSTKGLERAARVLWGLVLLTLPVTTFRYVPDFLGRTLVQPMAIYPLALLVLILGFLFWRSRRVPLPPNIKLLLAFLLFVLAVSIAGVLYAPIPMRNFSFDERVLRGWFSLLIGLVFFFAAFWMNRTEKDLQYSLKWIYAGLALTILWSLIQAVAVNTSLIPRGLVNQIQLLFSARPLLPRRISGFAYEPAWLADQIVIFYLPWIFAAILHRRPLLKQKWVEPLFFLLSIVVLVFTYSRGGLLSAFLCVLVVFVLLGRDLIRRGWEWLASPFRKVARSRSVGLLLRGVLLAAVIAGLVVTVAFLARYEYFASIWDLGDEENPVDYIVDISAGPRLAYAIAGYQVYEEAPLTGVGLGASGLYMLPKYPEWSTVIPEVARQLSPDSNLIPNTKSLYVRLLAETGLPGFWLFVIFFLSFLAIIRRMALVRNKTFRFIAAAGLFAWLGIALRNLTQDSFTIPIMWVILGMLAGLYSPNLKEFRFGKRNETIKIPDPGRRRPGLGIGLQHHQ